MPSPAAGGGSPRTAGQVCRPRPLVTLSLSCSVIGMTDLIPADVTGGDMFLVTGGTGTLGRLVVPQLVQAGGKVRVLSRHPRKAIDEGAAEGIEFMVGDLDTGQGIDAA